MKSVFKLVNDSNSRFIVAAITTFLSNYCYTQNIVDLIQPTGRWYESASSKIGHWDGCWEFNSTTTFEYKQLFQSLEQAKNSLYQESYNGGVCKETITDDNDLIPDDWPIVGADSSWNEYKINASAPRPQYYDYDCEDEDGIHYFFQFKLQPQYQCVDGSCNSFKKACAGDVYAGDLLQTPAEFLGHTGIIVTPEIEGDPDHTNMVMEVLDTPPIIHFDTTLGLIEKKRPIWGVRYGFGKIQKGEMTGEEADSIFYEGIRQSQYCPQYTKLPVYHVGGPEITSIKDPFTNKLKKILTSNCAVFRCDTFVKYLYKSKLNTDLPPYNVTQAPKDLFDAFINQRGETPSYFSKESIQGNKNETIINKANLDNDALWKEFYKSLKYNENRLDLLENITDTATISYRDLLSAINFETANTDIKTGLLLLLKQKLMSNQKSDPADWVKIRQITESIINQNDQPKLLANTLLVQRIIHPPEKVIKNISTLLKRVHKTISDGDELYIERTMSLVLFELLANSTDKETSRQIIEALKDLNPQYNAEGFSIFITDYPQIENKHSKGLVRNYLTGIEAEFFSSNQEMVNKFRAKIWSSAVFKLSANKKEYIKSLYNVAMRSNNDYVVSLLVLENKNYIPQKYKPKYINLLNTNKDSVSTSQNIKFKQASINKARIFLDTE